MIRATTQLCSADLCRVNRTLDYVAKDKSSHSCFVFLCSFFPRDKKKRIKRTNEGGNVKKLKVMNKSD